MTKKITAHSYKYIQGWLKDKYKKDPVFRQNQLFTSSICTQRAKMKKRVDMMTLSILAELYKQHVF